MPTTKAQDHLPRGAAPSDEQLPEVGDNDRRLVFDVRSTLRPRAGSKGSARLLRGVLWSVVIVVALFPIPWWWFW